MRVTQEGMVANAMLRLQQRLGRLDQAGQRLSSGKVVQVASDDVAGMNRVLSLRARIRAREQEERNAADATTWLNITDNKLQTVVGRLQRARDLTVRAANPMDPAARESIAQELEAVRDDIVGVVNTSIDGRPLFAGTENVAQAVALPGYTWQGNTESIQRRIGEQDVVTVNVTAGEVFGYTAGAGEDLFTKLDELIAAVRGGDTAGISAGGAAIDAGLDRVNEGLAKVGAATNRIDAAMVRNSDEQITLKGELAQVEDVDMAEAIMDLQTQEVAYQATLAALSRVIQPSLVDFLR